MSASEGIKTSTYHPGSHFGLKESVQTGRLCHNCDLFSNLLYCKEKEDLNACYLLWEIFFFVPLIPFIPNHLQEEWITWFLFEKGKKEKNQNSYNCLWNSMELQVEKWDTNDALQALRRGCPDSRQWVPALSFQHDIFSTGFDSDLYPAWPLSYWKSTMPVLG